MGLLTTALTAPVSLPLRSFTWIARKITEAAEAEYYNPAKVQAALRALEDQLDLGFIDEETFEREERLLLDRLKEIRKRQKDEELGHG
ncbi:MAG: gas vesicle protein GvpG [Alphaproteobacteria bacterium]